MWVLQEEIIFFFTLSFLPDLLSCGHRAFEGTAFLIFIIVYPKVVYVQWKGFSLYYLQLLADFLTIPYNQPELCSFLYRFTM